MNSKELFHQIYVKKNYPAYIDESYVFSIFEAVIYDLSPRIEKEFHESIPNPHVLLSYIVGEYNYILTPLSTDNRNKLYQDMEFKKQMIKNISSKIFFNEYNAVKAVNLINKFHPLISSFRFYINFVLERIVNLHYVDGYDSLKIDMLRKGFLSCVGVTSLLCEGFETEAFSTWRTIHETECIVKVIHEHEEVIDVYKHHISYNRAYRNEYSDKTYQQNLIDEIKVQLKEHNLKSKDLKKYIEYGWLYSINDWESKYPLLKLNFRNGIEYVAGLNAYSSLYEMSSEIAHSSPMLFYSNKMFFLRICLISLYETFFRMEKIFSMILNKQKKEETQLYFNLRSSYLDELKLMLAKEKLIFKQMNENN